MNIGIDLDGVLFDTEEYFRCSGELYDIEIGGGGMVKPNHIKMQYRYDWEREYFDDYILKYLLEIERIAPVKPYAKLVIEKLKEDGHKLICITSRGVLDDEEIEITKKRLKEEGIIFDKLFFAQANKVKCCQDEKIDVMIDDYFDFIQSISNSGINCLYFRDNIQDDIINPYVRNVKNWGEVYRQILNLSKIKQ